MKAKKKPKPVKLHPPFGTIYRMRIYGRPYYGAGKYSTLSVFIKQG